MTKVTVCIDFEKAKYKAYEVEARRQGLTVEQLVRKAIHQMFVEHDEAVREEEDSHPIQF